MKKLIDKFVVQSISRQVIIGGGILAALTVLAALVWYFVTVPSARLAEADAAGAPLDLHFIVKTVLASMFRVLTIAIFTGIFTRTLQARKEKIMDGEVAYRFTRNYALVVGYDVQVRQLVRKLVRRKGIRAVVIVTSSDTAPVYAELKTDLKADDLRRVFVLRRNLTAPETYASFTVRGARELYLMGDAGSLGRDGMVLRVQELLAARAAKEPVRGRAAARVKTYLHLETPGLFAQMRTKQLAMDRQADIFDLDVFNIYDSWAWRCWSDLSEAARAEDFPPLRFRAGSSRVELFVLGYGKVGKAVVDAALPLMNYGAVARTNRITVIHDGPALDETFPSEDVRAALPETELVWYDEPVVGEASCRRIVAAAEREDTAVTVVIVADDPDRALRTYAALPSRLRRMEVTVLLWMATPTANLPDLDLLKVEGDRVRLRCFGMTDLLPWYDNGRTMYGAAINYFYSILDTLPSGTDPALVARAAEVWDLRRAQALWAEVPRWAKGSSLCGGDVFKERLAMMPAGAPTPATLENLLRTEHNRWWTERLVNGWKACPPPVDDADRAAKRRAFLHWNLVPFEELDAATRDIDKINIAAMAVCAGGH